VICTLCDYSVQFSWHIVVILQHCAEISKTGHEHQTSGDVVDCVCIVVEQESRTLRINDIHELVHQLPESNFDMLVVLVAHLCK